MQEKYETLTVILKTRRRELKLSQSDMAKILDISQGRFSTLENNPEKFRLWMLEKICKKLNLDFDYIIKPQV